MSELSSQILVIDETIREGMQYRGLMFSFEERLNILCYQETLGVDMSQVGYPSAHISEFEIVKALNKKAQKRGYNIRIAALGRANLEDARLMIKLGLKDFHLHSGINQEMLQRMSAKHIFNSLAETVGLIRKKVKNSFIKISLLDIGRTNNNLLNECVSFLVNDLHIDILALPDTSGVLMPNIFYKKIQEISVATDSKNIIVAVHCHNDMGMASANTLMGVIAGATGIEVSALGIGERNGIGDIFTVGKCLKDQNYPINIKIEDTELFEQYYLYINSLCKKKLGTAILDYETPFFGSSMKMHVAGTHGAFKHGIITQEEYCLNVLCGKNLVKKYLNSHDMIYKENKLKDIVAKIKDESVMLGRALSEQEVYRIALDVSKANYNV